MSITWAKVIDGCISCKNCENICPEIFKVDPKSTIISDKFNQNALKLLMAEKMCPVNVIKVEKEGADYDLSFASATLRSKKYLTTYVLELTFDTEDFVFQPWQYVSLQMEDIRWEFSRSYSVASGTKDSFTLTVKLLEKGRWSSYLRKLWKRSITSFFQKRDKIEFTGWLWDFILQDTKEKKVMIATGTGLAPIMAMLDALPDEVEKLLIFGVREESDLFYLEKLKQYKNLEIRTCISRTNWGWETWKRVTECIWDIEEDNEVYICGNPEMVSDVREKLAIDGHDLDKIYHEDFTLAQKPISLSESIFFEWQIPGVELFQKILIYLSILGLPIFYFLWLRYNFLVAEIWGKNMYDWLFMLTWFAVIPVMFIRPLADIFPKLKILRRLVVLRKSFWIFSASIIVTMLVAKWIQNPQSFLDFVTLASWSGWRDFTSLNFANIIEWIWGHSLTARLSELTALILLATSNTFSQKTLWIWWKRIQRSSYIYFYSGPFIALQYSSSVLEYYIPMILLPVVWFLARFRIQLWK
jgi:NAD(P)H-flavin reductase/ferredoxin